MQITHFSLGVFADSFGFIYLFKNSISEIIGAIPIEVNVISFVRLLYDVQVVKSFETKL